MIFCLHIQSLSINNIFIRALLLVSLMSFNTEATDAILFFLTTQLLYFDVTLTTQRNSYIL